MAVSADALYKASEFGKESDILSYFAYKSHRRANKFKVLKNACRGNAPLLDWDTMDFQLQAKIKDVYGDPYKVVSRNRLLEVLVNDSEAYSFYNSFIKDDGATLSERQIKQYTGEASILKAVQHLMINRVARMRAIGVGKKAQVWDKLAQSIADLNTDQWGHKLPANPRSLERKYRKFVKEGYESLVHGQTGKKNAEKINSDAKIWLISRWGNQVEKSPNLESLLVEYNDRAKNLRWKPLKHEATLRNFLYEPEVEVLWYRNRYGDKSFNNKYAYQHSTKLPSMRDSLWYADGTKLNFFYQYVTELGERKIGTMQVYEVMDAFSEVFLGYHISSTENYEAQFFAFKMAAQFSGHRPYELKVDNQGGHKKLKSSSFLDKIAHLSLNTKPYNGRSKTIESAFGRFQSTILKEKWYFTGQNITAKADESKANLQFINENKDSLPTLDEVKSTYKQLREKWNNAKHPNFDKTRLELYNESMNPATPELNVWDMVDMFWVLKDQPSTCFAGGISFELNKQRYDYVVYENNGKQGYERDIDVRWIAQNVGRKFFVKYDPADMSLIYLYVKSHDGTLQFIGEAETKIVPARNIQEQDEWNARFYARVQKASDELRIELKAQMDQMQAQYSMRAEDYGMNTPRIMGLETGKRAKNAERKEREAEKAEQKEREASWKAAEQDSDKYTSNYTPVSDDDIDSFDSLVTVTAQQRLASKI